MLFKSILIASALAAFANAQTIATSSASSVAASSTVAQSMPPTATQGFDANNVTSSQKFQWCLAQQNTCPQICGGAASTNFCDSNTLTYNCVCPNGTVPDSTAYIQTLPYFLCEATFGQCINSHPNDAEGQATCTNNEKCGTRNATAEALAATSTMSMSTASSTSSGSSGSSSTGSAASSGSSASATSNAGAVTTITTGAFGAMLMAAFKFLL